MLKLLKNKPAVAKLKADANCCKETKSAADNKAKADTEATEKNQTCCGCSKAKPMEAAEKTKLAADAFVKADAELLKRN
jgi:hypothetical protein